MAKQLSAAVLALCLMLPTTLQAQTSNGDIDDGHSKPAWVVANYVHVMCQASDPDRVMECNDYLRGVADTLGYLSDWKECFIKADNTQLRLAFLLYATQHPDELAGPAAKMVKEALTTQFPCQKP